MTKFFLSGLLFIFFLASCHERIASQQEISDTFFYNTYAEHETLFEVKSISCQGFISDQQLSIKLGVKKNKSEKLTPELWELTDSAGIRSLPVRSAITGDEQSENINIDLVYEPVSSRKLFQQTGLRGDLKSNYCLNVTHPANPEIKQIICFAANDTIHKKSVEKFGLAATTTPYVVAKLIEDSLDLKSASKKIIPVKGDQPIVSGNEILTRGFWSKFSGYYKNDTLNFHLRMVNQSSYGVIIKKDDLLLVNETSILKPEDSNETVMELRNGGRGELFLKFVVEKNRAYTLDLRGMQFNSPAKEAIFNHRVIFTALPEAELP